MRDVNPPNNFTSRSQPPYHSDVIGPDLDVSVNDFFQAVLNSIVPTYDVKMNNS